MVLSDQTFDLQGLTFEHVETDERKKFKNSTESEAFIDIMYLFLLGKKNRSNAECFRYLIEQFSCFSNKLFRNI